MRTSEILDKIKIPRHKLYYLEQKGYIAPKRIPMGDLESRDYSKEDYLKIQAIWKYLQKGYKHRSAYEQAMKELNGDKK
jgi:DNA-binding transcriptional MerR regulator